MQFHITAGLVYISARACSVAAAAVVHWHVQYWIVLRGRVVRDKISRARRRRACGGGEKGQVVDDDDIDSAGRERKEFHAWIMLAVVCACARAYAHANN